MRLQLRSLVAAVALLFAASPMARAVDITFDLNSGVSGKSSFSKTVSGITLTFLNPASGGFAGDGDGLEINDVKSSFQMQVIGSSLNFLNYTVGYTNFEPANPFDLTGGTGTSFNNSLSKGVFSYNGSYSISPGQTVTLTSPNNSNVAFSQIKVMTFTVASVPEPSTYALAAIATGVMAAIARRRKARKG